MYRRLSKLMASIMLLSSVLMVWTPLDVHAEDDEKAILSEYTEDSMYETEYMSLMDGMEVDNEIEEIYESNLEAGVSTYITNRDYHAYTSRTIYYNLPYNYKVFYDRIDEMAYSYLTDAAKDAVTNASGKYVMSGIDYSDLGMSRQEVYAICELFYYNNPQYYFLRPGFSTTSTSVYIKCYDIFANGQSRAYMTNALFADMDNWANQVSGTDFFSTQSNTHTMICNSFYYQQSEYDQSVYSAFDDPTMVCAGYAELYSALMNKNGYDTVVAISATHAWNMSVLPDGNWYITDSCWNDILDGNPLYNVGQDKYKKYDSRNQHDITARVSSYYPSLAAASYDSSPIDDTKPPLASPTNIVVEKKSDTSVHVGFDSVANAYGYLMCLYTDANHSQLYTSAELINPGATITYLNTYQTYYITVQSLAYYSDPYSDSNITSFSFNISELGGGSTQPEPSPVDETTPTPTPSSQPQNPTPTPSGSTVTTTAYPSVVEFSPNRVAISWPAVSSATKYQICLYNYSNGTVGSAKVMTNISGTTASFKNLDTSKSYWFTVAPVIGGQVSTKPGSCVVSNVSGDSQTQPTTPTPSPSAPSNPTPTPSQPSTPTNTALGVSYTLSGTNRVSFTWNQVGKPYTFEVATDSAFANRKVVTTVRTNSVSVTGLTTGNTWYVRVTANNGTTDTVVVSR